MTTKFPLPRRWGVHAVASYSTKQIEELSGTLLGDVWREIRRLDEEDGTDIGSRDYGLRSWNSAHVHGKLYAVPVSQRDVASVAFARKKFGDYFDCVDMDAINERMWEGCRTITVDGEEIYVYRIGDPQFHTNYGTIGRWEEIAGSLDSAATLL